VSASPVVSAAEPTPAQKLVGSPRLLIIAHRGNSSVAPENTLPAFQSALDANADLVELDYYHSADGIPIVIHDESLDRTTNSEGIFGRQGFKVGGFSIAELQNLDAGFWFDARFAGNKLPTLSQSLDLIQSKSVTLIERKGGDAQTLVRLLEEKGLLDRVVVQAFDWKFVTACRKLSPQLALATLHGKPATEELIRNAANTGANVIVWDHEKITPEQIGLIHQLGKKAWVYTVDKTQRAEQLMAAGIDGIITNKPGEIIKLREKP
jgi:glycerophosphoryl diester phosphodiesterase